MKPVADHSDNILASMWMSSTFLADLITLNSPDEMSRELCEQIRDLTGAKTVAFFLTTGENHKTCQPSSVCPEQHAQLFKNGALTNLCMICHPEPLPETPSQLPEHHPLRKPLEEAGIQNLLRIPIRGAEGNTGFFALLNLPHPEKSDEIFSMMEFLGPTISLAIQNCIARHTIQTQYDTLEKQVEARTAEIEQANQELNAARIAALNMMEDALLAKQKLEITQFSLDHAADPVYWIDPNGKFTYVNEAACRSLGYDKNEFSGISIFDLDPNLTPEIWDARWQEYMKVGFRNFQTSHQTKDGRVFPVEIHANHIQFGGSERLCAYAHDITERNRQEDALRANEEMMRSSQSVAHICSYSTNLKLDGLEESRWVCSPEFYTLFGIDETYPHTIAGWARFIHPDFRDEVVAYHESVVREKKSFNKEYKIIRINDGAERWVHGTGELEFDKTGTPIRMHGAIQDITERKDAEKKIRFEQELFRSFMDMMPAAVYFKDSEGRFLRTNKHKANEVGESETSILGKTDFDFMPQEDARAAFDIEQQILRDNQPRQFEECSNGIWFLSTKAPHYDLNGNLAGIFGISFDITERRQAEAELLRLSTAIEQSAETIVITDAQGAIEYVNPAFEKTTGYSRDDVMGENPSLLKSGEHSDAFYTALWDTLSRGEIWNGQFVNKRKDGSLYTEEAAISPVKAPDGTITNYVGIKRDITHELAQEERLQQAQKMEAIGQLAGGIAHDFNNILQAILGFSELLMITLDEKLEQPRTNVMEIQKAAKHAADLTKQLLAFSREQNIELTQMDVNLAVKNTSAFIVSIIGENVRIQTELDPELKPARADSQQIDRVLLNLAMNARDAMPDGGKLTIRTKNVEFSAEDAQASAQIRTGQFVCLSVSDDGTGMSEETKQHIFEPFFTTKAPGKGTGLGLSAIYGIIKKHNGWVSVYSEQGQGSIFKVYLPVYTDEMSLPAAKTAAPSNLDKVHGRGERILIVEDDPAVLNLSKNALQRAGYRVETARSAEEAEVLFKKADEAFDLLFSDVILPNKNGADLAATLIKIKPDLPILLCSGYSGNRIKQAGISQNDFFFLEKPFSIVNLLKHVNRILDQNGKGH